MAVVSNRKMTFVSKLIIYNILFVVLSLRSTSISHSFCCCMLSSKYLGHTLYSIAYSFPTAYCDFIVYIYPICTHIYITNRLHSHLNICAS